jgi:F0F1-type ATP synthase assembly protein I
MLDSDSKKSIKQLGEYSSLGIQMVGIIAVFGGIGWWIDSRFSLKPWGMMFGCLLGAGGGMYYFIRAIIQANREADEEK